MTLVSGDLRLVTDQPLLVDTVMVRARELRSHGSGVVVDFFDQVDVVDGRVEFECLPGPAVLVVSRGGVPQSPIRLLVSDTATQSLKEAMDSASLADDSSRDAVEELAQRVASMVKQAGRIASDTRWDGDQLVVNGEKSPHLSGPQGKKGDKGEPGDAGVATWEALENKPESFPPEKHTHTPDDVDGLPDVMDRVNNATYSVEPYTLMLRTGSGAVSVAEPTASVHAANRAYVDDAVQPISDATYSAVPDSIMKRTSGGQVSVAAPTAGAHAANRDYVDAEVGGLKSAIVQETSGPPVDPDPDVLYVEVE